jgi:hypothetical protein
VGGTWVLSSSLKVHGRILAFLLALSMVFSQITLMPAPERLEAPAAARPHTRAVRQIPTSTAGHTLRVGTTRAPPAAAREPSSPHPKNPARPGLAKRLRVGTPALRHVHLIAARPVLPRRHPELTLPRSKAPEGWRSPRRFAFAGPLGISARFWTAAALCRFRPVPSRTPC